jgi:hypothetical protein
MSHVMSLNQLNFRLCTQDSSGIKVGINKYRPLPEQKSVLSENTEQSQAY